LVVVEVLLLLVLELVVVPLSLPVSVRVWELVVED
jgi:hypothetical protein